MLASKLQAYKSQNFYGVSTRVQQLRDKQSVLRKTLKDQVRIAKKLQTMEGPDSKDTMCAWDTVEEISRKISRISQLITHDMISDEESLEYQELLGERVYDV